MGQVIMNGCGERGSTQRVVSLMSLVGAAFGGSSRKHTHAGVSYGSDVTSGVVLRR